MRRTEIKVGMVVAVCQQIGRVEPGDGYLRRGIVLDTDSQWTPDTRTGRGFIKEEAGFALGPVGMAIAVERWRDDGAQTWEPRALNADQVAGTWVEHVLALHCRARENERIWKRARVQLARGVEWVTELNGDLTELGLRLRVRPQEYGKFTPVDNDTLAELIGLARKA